MKIKRFVWMFVCLFSLIFGNVSAQTLPVSLDVENVSLSDVLSDIEKQTDYLFVYNNDVDATVKVSVKAVNEPLNVVLNEMLKSKDVRYSVKEKSIMLFKAGTESVPNSDAPNKLSGVVVDNGGLPLIGASVLIKGTNIGTVTDMEGKFSFGADASKTISNENKLIVNYIGYVTQTVNIGNRTYFNIVMADDALFLSDVVVTALGIKREKKALSYNVQEVSADAIVAHKDANFINSLNGKVAGVTINASSSGVGGASKVIMRGSKTISRSSNALYVIDGVPMFNFGDEGSSAFASTGSTESIADINPEDIQSISVLTGASAAALYGSDASNGAIIITTKKGEAGQVKLTINSGVEVSAPFILPKFQNSYGTGDYNSSIPEHSRSWGDKLDPLDQTGYTPQDDYFKTGVISNQSISLSTGTERNQTYISAAAINSDGIVPNNAYDRYNFTIRNTTEFLDEKMTLDIGASYIKQYDRNMINQGTYNNPIVGAYLYPRGNDWSDIQMYERYNPGRGISEQYWPNSMLDKFDAQNPYWINHRTLRENNKNRYMMNIGLTYKITDWISLAARVRMDNSSNVYTKKNYASTNHLFTQASTQGSYGVQNTNNTQTYADFLVNLNKSWGDFNIHANIGTSYTDLQSKSLKVEGGIRSDLIPNKFNVMQLDQTASGFVNSESGWRDQTQSVFASAEFGYKGTYYLTFTGRNDTPSQLAGPHSNVTSFFYPSVGGSIVLSNAIDMPDQIEYLKLRGSFASVGLPFARFLANPTYGWDNASAGWETQSHYPIYDLKSEKTDSYEVGLTMNFFEHFNVDLGLYRTRTYNQTFNPKISVSSGYSTIYVQTGNVQNQGVELALGYENTWNKFTWASNYMFSTNDNEILELLENYAHPETGEIITLDKLVMEEAQGVEFTLKKGGTMGDVYINHDFNRDAQGNILIDEEGNLSVNKETDDIKLGSVFAKANMSWNNNFSYAGFSLGFLITARLGGVVFSRTQSELDAYGVSQASEAARDAGGVWINGGQDLVDPNMWYNTLRTETLMQYHTYDATNVRLQEVSISYSIPRSKLSDIADITVSLVGRNLFMFYCKAPFDPEAVATTGNYYQGFDNFMMPSLRNIGFNIRLNF